MIEKIEAVKSISLDDLKTFARQFKETFRLEGLVQGNYSKDQALEVARNMTTRLQPTQRKNALLSQIRICQVPAGNRACRLASFHPTDSNSVCVNYYQVGKQIDSFLFYLIIPYGWFFFLSFFRSYKHTPNLRYLVYLKLNI